MARKHPPNDTAPTTSMLSAHQATLSTLIADTCRFVLRFQFHPRDKLKLIQ